MTDVSEITMEEQQSTAPLMATNGNTKSTLKVGNYPESESTVTLQRSASPGGSPQVRFQVTPTLSSRGSREAARRRTASSSSHFSDSSSPDDDSVTLERHAPDGGWGWVVVAASFIVNMIADGVGFSFGVFFVEFLRYFRASKSTTAWLGSIFLALPLLLGPVASSLVDRFGCRKSTIAGSLLAATGFLLSYFANSMEILFLTFSIMPGIGLSVCYVSAVVIVAYYFERRRSLATGISVCGTGVGTFLFPPMVELLLQEYGWRGSLLILSGVFLNMAVCGMLMKDLDWTKHKNRERSSQITLSGVGDSDSIPGDADSLPDIEQLRNALNSGDVVALLGRSVSQEQLERLHSSALQLPTWLADQDVSPEVLKTIDSNHKIHDLVYRLYPHLLANGPTEEAAATVTGAEAVAGVAEEGRAGPDPGAAPSAGFTIGYGDWKENVEGGATATKSETTTQKEAEAATGNGKPADASDIYTGSPADASAPGGWEQFRSDNVLSTVDHTNMPVPEARVSRSVPHQRHQREQQMHQQRHRYQTPRTSARTSNLLPLFSCDSAPSAAYLRNMRLRRQSMTYRGAMLHIQRYRLRASSCPDIYRNSMITITSREEDETCCGCLSDIARVMRKMIDPSYFRLPGFMLFALSNFVLYMFYDVPYVYLADDAIQRGTSDEDASMLISVIGVSNVIGVLSIGYLGDRPWVSSTVLYVTCMLSCGASILLVPSCDSYSALVAVSAVFGFCISANYTLAPTILVSLISIDNFTSAYGLLLLAQGLANLVGPPLCGMLHDLTSTYELTFRTSGTAVVISGLLLCLARLVKAARASKRALKRVTSTDTSGAMSATGSTDMI